MFLIVIMILFQVFGILKTKTLKDIKCPEKRWFCYMPALATALINGWLVVFEMTPIPITADFQVLYFALLFGMIGAFVGIFFSITEDETPLWMIRYRVCIGFILAFAISFQMFSRGVERLTWSAIFQNPVFLKIVVFGILLFLVGYHIYHSRKAKTYEAQEYGETMDEALSLETYADKEIVALMKKYDDMERAEKRRAERQDNTLNRIQTSHGYVNWNSGSHAIGYPVRAVDPLVAMHTSTVDPLVAMHTSTSEGNWNGNTVSEDVPYSERDVTQRQVTKNS